MKGLNVDTICSESFQNEPEKMWLMMSSFFCYVALMPDKYLPISEAYLTPTSWLVQMAEKSISTEDEDNRNDDERSGGAHRGT